MKLKTGLLTAAVAIFGAFSASAATVTYFDGPDATGGQRFSVTCDTACEGWLFDAATLGGASGGLIDFLDTSYATGTGEAWEKNLLATIAGTTLSYQKDDSPSTSFTSDAAYILFKIGKKPNVGVLFNTAGSAQEYEFTDLGGGSGLSHYSEYGATVVPLPAGLPLLLAGLGALALVRRRR